MNRPQPVVKTKEVVTAPIMQRIAKSEPVTCLHGKTSVDSSLIATIGIYMAQTSIVFLIPISTIYIVCWVVLAVKTHI